ncbi:MAG: hypothetical protein WA430_14580 [Acidobacteriaceae bacterium]
MIDKFLDRGVQGRWTDGKSAARKLTDVLHNPVAMLFFLCQGEEHKKRRGRNGKIFKQILIELAPSSHQFRPLYRFMIYLNMIFSSAAQLLASFRWGLYRCGISLAAVRNDSSKGDGANSQLGISAMARAGGIGADERT